MKTSAENSPNNVVEHSWCQSLTTVHRRLTFKVWFGFIDMSVNCDLSHWQHTASLHWVKGSVNVLFWNLHSRGEMGRRGRECKFQNKAHRTSHPRNTLSHVHIKGAQHWTSNVYYTIVRKSQSLPEPMRRFCTSAHFRNGICPRRERKRERDSTPPEFFVAH